MNQPQNSEKASAAEAAPQSKYVGEGVPEGHPTTRKPTPVQEWDITASIGMEEVLVGKAGYKTMPVKKGGVKMRAVNVTFFPESRVQHAKSSARKLLRTFRAAIRIQYGKDLAILEDQLKSAEGELESLCVKKFPDSVFGWPNRARMAELREEIKVLTIEIGTIRSMMDTLEKVSPRIFDEEKIDNAAANILINS